MPSVTLLDLMKLKSGSDGALHLVQAVGLAAPEVLALPSKTITGTSYDVTLVKSYPTVSFRKANQGMSASRGEFETRKAECFILDARIEVDKAVARKHDKGPDALMALYSMITGKSSILSMGNQTIYGTALDGSGFPGLQEMVLDAMTVDATGSTANAGSSVYFVFGDEDFGVSYVYGNDSSFELQPFVDGEGEDAAGKKFPAHIGYLNCAPGLSNASPFAVGVIKNLTAQAGKGLTDSLGYQLLEKFPTDVKPTHVLMNRAARGQLQRSRTVTLMGNGKKGDVGGAEGTIAPLPDFLCGIPIVCTDSITSLEAIR
ncbi:MAG: major capsid protein [Luteolibacter sp.]|uniref:major capsid protein n=1 Tax=Luteolibacter sp. TaxID=1962973 RepID=UPI0032655D4E